MSFQIQYSDFVQSGTRVITGTVSLDNYWDGGTFVYFKNPFQIIPQFLPYDTQDVHNSVASYPNYSGGVISNVSAQSSTVVKYSLWSSGTEYATSFMSAPSVSVNYCGGESGTLAISNVSSTSFTLHSSVAGTVSYTSIDYKNLPNKFALYGVASDKVYVYSLKPCTMQFMGFGINSD